MDRRWFLSSRCKSVLRMLCISLLKDHQLYRLRGGIPESESGTITPKGPTLWLWVLEVGASFQRHWWKQPAFLPEFCTFWGQASLDAKSQPLKHFLPALWNLSGFNSPHDLLRMFKRKIWSWGNLSGKPVPAFDIQRCFQVDVTFDFRERHTWEA